MEEEMRKIEEEFAFQEKWIEIFKRGKFFFQNIPELLILKIITKMEAKVFFNLLRTGKWMHLLCRENRDFLIIPLDVLHIVYHSSKADFGSKKTKERVEEFFQLIEKLIRSKYYFHLYEVPFNCDLFTEFYTKNSYYFNRRCWRSKILSTHVTSMNKELVQSLQPEIINLLDRNQNGPMVVNFSLPTITKHLIVHSNAIIASDFYSEIERFGSLNCMITLNRKGRLECKKLLSIMKEVTKTRHLNHPLLEFLTFSGEKYGKYRIFESWPKLYDLPINDLSTQMFYFIIVARSEIAITVAYLLRSVYDEQEHFTIEFERIASSQELKAYVDNGEHLAEIGDSFVQSYANEEFEKQQAAFTKLVYSKFFEGGKLVYPPLAPPEPAPELVEFLKEFENFDIQPEKLAPHKLKWEKTDKLPDLPRKLPEIHSNNWLIEAKEIIKLRKFWMDFLQKKKFVLELLPKKNVVDIAKRIERKRFPLLFSSTRWVNELIQNSASNFRIHGGRSRFVKDRIYKDSSVFKEALKSLEFYYLNDISFTDFNTDTNYLKKVLQWVKERNIFVREISIEINNPLIQELFESFARGPELLNVSHYVTLPAPVKFSPQLKKIVVKVDFYGQDRIERIKGLIEGFTGIEQAVTWRCFDYENTNKIITHHLETLKSKKCRSNILIRSWNELHLCIINYNPQFDLSQISETVFIFRSMARGRGGVWNYFIRLEKAGSGAVGVAYYLDSIHVEKVEKNRFNRFNIRCEYLPTMKSFLNYFQREVGSKRRTRDWMQLKKKYEAIEPREEDFNHYKIQKPYIHFNKQKEANDLEEVRRRFFS